MTTQASFDPPQVHTGSPEDYVVLGVLLGLLREPSLRLPSKGGFLGFTNGTSIAAPQVAHAACLALDALGRAGSSQSANAVRALLGVSAETLGSILWMTPEMPWDFQHNVARHQWDEIRHSQLGQIRSDRRKARERAGIGNERFHDRVPVAAERAGVERIKRVALPAFAAR